MNETQGRLAGRVAIVTGAGRGLGRSHALYLASQGAAVVVNDVGGDVHGAGASDGPAHDVVREIEAAGGRATASTVDISNWDQAGELVQTAVQTFGDLHILVNNAGILRDRTFANMTEEEWDAVIRVHLKGHAGPAHHAMVYWRDQSKSGRKISASVVHTTSVAAFSGNFGQANYSAAKSAIIGLSRVIAMEGERYGVRPNAVSPSAWTRMALAMPGAEERERPTLAPGELDPYDPGNVSPVVGWLAEESCPANAQVFHVYGNRLIVVSMPSLVHDLRNSGRWTPEDLDREVPSKLIEPPTLETFLGR